MPKDTYRRPFVVCLRADEPTEFTDNAFGYCSRCSCQVQYRPDVQTPNRLLCVPCLIDISEDNGGLVEFAVVTQSVRDLY